jgi:hypothetical protein
VFDDWFPGYFGSGHVQFMLRLTDRYPMMVPVHGGQVVFNSRRIVFSTNTPPENMDNKEYSGYNWDASNPLFNRVFLREKPWKLQQIGEYKYGDKYYKGPAPPVVLEKSVKGLRSRPFKSLSDVERSVVLSANEFNKKMRLD